MRGIAVLGVAGLALVASGTASAQQAMIMGDMITATGTVEKIDKANRQVTLKGADGKEVTVDVSKEAKRFDEVKVGDTVTLSYVDAVVVRLKKPDEKSVDTLETEKATGERERPGGYGIVKRTMTATIEALDPSVPSVSFKGPGGWKYTRRIRDPKIVEQVKAGKIKVGDRVDFTWYLAADVTVK